MSLPLVHLYFKCASHASHTVFFIIVIFYFFFGHLLWDADFGHSKHKGSHHIWLLSSDGPLFLHQKALSPTSAPHIDSFSFLLYPHPFSFIRSLFPPLILLFLSFGPFSIIRSLFPLSLSLSLTHSHTESFPERKNKMKEPKMIKTFLEMTRREKTNQKLSWCIKFSD